LRARCDSQQEQAQSWTAYRGQATRWYCLAIYQTKGGKWVGCVTYKVAGPVQEHGERDDQRAEICESPAALAKWFKSYDPLIPVHGWPPGDRFRERQERLLKHMKALYERQVSALFEQLPEMVETVD
jgi:hypothetical protein